MALSKIHVANRLLAKQMHVTSLCVVRSPRCLTSISLFSTPTCPRARTLNQLGCELHQPVTNTNPGRQFSSGPHGSESRSGPFGSGRIVWRSLVAIAASVTGVVLYTVFQKQTCAAEIQAPGVIVKGLPTYTLADVAKHKTKENRIWVTYLNGVYDITDFVANHPGGSHKIILAAGSSIEPFWAMYASHKTPEVYEMLEELRIGNIVEVDAKVQQMDKNDPYANDPKRNPILILSSGKPFNAEPPATLLTDNFLTPNEIFYIRNHLPVPVVNPKTYCLSVSVEGARRPATLTLDTLKRKYKKKTVAAVVQCAGNRRSDMTKIKAVKGLNWRAAAIGNAEWSGATLNDVLLRAGIDIEKVNCKHVQFEGLDKGPEGTTYGASIPIDLARQLKDEILVAYEMNGKEIPQDHGYPVRVIIPGIVGARQVKWLHNIILSDNESDCHWQQRDYKGFHSSIDWHNVDFSTVPAIMELPVQSAICDPQDGVELEAGSEEVTLQGYAWSGGGRGIVRVDVSVDGGKNWHSATLQQTKQPLYKTFAWTLWEATVPLPSNHGGKVELVCKAADSSYNVQPDNVEGIWNLRGVLSNAWHRVQVTVPKE